MHFRSSLRAAAVLGAGVVAARTAFAQSSPPATQPSSSSASSASSSISFSVPPPPVYAAPQQPLVVTTPVVPPAPRYLAPASQPAETKPPATGEFAPPPPPPAAPTMAAVPGTRPVGFATTQPAALLPTGDQFSFTQPNSPQAPTNGTLSDVIVTSDLDQKRDAIAPSLGARAYTIGPNQIADTPGGENASFQQVLLRAPGVVPDSFGQEHVRGEHANLTYRVNGVLLPEPLNGFGQELDTHLINSVTLIDGSLPAQFGFHTAGIVDVTTKTGAALDSNEVSIYGGSYNTFQPSLQLGGSVGKLDYFFTGSYLSNSDGIENPVNSNRPIHDNTEQTRGFGYLAYNLDNTSRISLILNTYYGNFQLPNTPGLPPQFAVAAEPHPSSANLNENQNEQEDYAVVSYQKTIDKFSLQLSAFSRYGLLDFQPDAHGDLAFQGLAGAVHESFVTNGAQFDTSYELNKQHTIRAGFVGDYTLERQVTSTAVFPTDPVTGNQSSDIPFGINGDVHNRATEAGVYLQDEFKITKKLTANYGFRYDRYDSSFDDEGQLSPRANFVYQFDKKTTAHIGYSRYFVAPPAENTTAAEVARFDNTTNAAAVPGADAPKAERSNYYDIGIGRQITTPWSVNFDGFYKEARNLIDLGQFGSAVILSPYNYRHADVYGAEASSTYKAGPWSLFGNLAWVQTRANEVVSQQFEFDPDELAYIKNNIVHLDHEAEFTASAGASYLLTKDDLVTADFLYGSGLRAGFANTLEEPSYYPINLGYQHVFHPNSRGNQTIKFRADVTNVFDQHYQIRDGNGIGTSSAQWGQRRAFFLGLAYQF